jgi:hypothetical protein
MKRLFLVPVFMVAVALSSPATATTIVYSTSLSGAAESPPNASPGTGSAIVTVDDVANTMWVQVSFSDLIGTTTASHIHCCTATAYSGTAGVATVVPTFTGFPIGVTSGTYDHTFDMLSTASWNPAFITANGGTAAGAWAALLAGMATGDAYLNIHTIAVPGGEIRGFLAVPEPGTLTLLGLGLAGLGLSRRRKAA